MPSSLPKVRFYLLLLSACLTFLFCSFALAQEYGFDVWTTANGLPQNTVNGVVQTPDGYLWVGTYNGLARFDGVRFVVFADGPTPGLQSSRVTSLYEDADHGLWIGHETGGLTL